MKPWLTLILFLFLGLHAFTQRYKRSTPAHQLGVTISLPLVNGYEYYNHESAAHRTGTGLFGIGGALFYRHKKIKYSLNGSYTRHRHGKLRPLLQLAPLLVPNGNTDYPEGGPMRKLKVSTLEGLVHLPIVGPLKGVAGLHYRKYYYEYNMKKDYLINTERWIDHTLGITSGLEFGKGPVTLALLYRPAMLSFHTKYHYQHTLTLDCRFDITCWKNK